MDPATRRRHARPSLADRARHAKRRGQNSRWPALDGLRAFAVLTVMAAHLNDPHFFAGGGLGVDVFFVISGFLITSILLGEQDKRGRVGFGAFYARRALRLFPALVVVLAVVAVVCATDSHIFLAHETLAGIPWIVLYAGNWLRAFSHAASLGVLGHTWSLAVEEQFYLIWPVIFVFGIGRIGDRRRAAALLVSAALAVMAYRAVVLAHGWSINRVSNGSDTHCDGLLLGCALALWLTSGAEVVMPRVSAVLTVISGAMLVAIMLAVKDSTVLEGVGYPVAEVATVGTIWNLVTSPLRPLEWILAKPPVLWIGRRSYGLYLWHYPIYGLLAGGPGVPPRDWPGALILSFAAAALSFRFVEQPFLNRKQRFETVGARQEVGIQARP
jgi:peptidoglycan/LPS O-acetylase OafA/YrhL